MDTIAFAFLSISSSFLYGHCSELALTLKRRFGPWSGGELGVLTVSPERRGLRCIMFMEIC